MLQQRSGTFEQLCVAVGYRNDLLCVCLCHCAVRGGRGKLKDGSDTAARLAEAGKWLKRAVTLDATRQEPYAMLAERYVRRDLRVRGPSLL